MTLFIVKTLQNMTLFYILLRVNIDVIIYEKMENI